MLSSPPVHSLVPSWEMSMQLAPSVWPWNCLQHEGAHRDRVTHSAHFPRYAVGRSGGRWGRSGGCGGWGTDRRGPGDTHLTSVWLWRSHTAMLPSLQQEKQTLASGLMARA